MHPIESVAKFKFLLLNEKKKKKKQEQLRFFRKQSIALNKTILKPCFS